MEDKLNIYTRKRVECSRSVLPWYTGLMLLALYLPLHTQGVSAGLPEFYGEEFVKNGQSWPDAGIPAGSPSRISATSPDLLSDKAYAQQLDQFESEEGPYADTLAEPLLGLGQYHASRGEYDKAVQLYRRALHNVRLNDGLYSERQAPIVRQLLNTVRLTGDLNALDDRYDYFFRLYGNGQPPFTELRIRAALEYLRWQREAIRLGLDSNERRRLLGLYQLNEDLLEAATASVSISIEDRWALALSQIRNLYLLQSKVTPRVESSGVNTRSTFQALSGHEDEMDFDRRKLETIQRSALTRGSDVLEQYIAALDSTLSPTNNTGPSKLHKKARALLELGDWHQWNGGYRRADEYYVRAMASLEENGELELARQWFSLPVELPDNGAFWQPPTTVGEHSPLLVNATYDVSTRGRVKNLSTPTPEPEMKGLTNRFKRELKGTRFRPRYSGGQAVLTEQLLREYEVYK